MSHRLLRSFGVLLAALAMAGCGETDPTVGPEVAPDLSLRSGNQGHHLWSK